MTKTAYKWDLTPLYKSDNDPAIDKELKRLQKNAQDFNAKWSKRDDYLTDSRALKNALDAYEKYLRQYYLDTSAGFYIHLRSNQDQSNSKVKARSNQISETINKARILTEFFHVNLGKITPSNQKKFLASPELKPYKYFLVRIFRAAKHMLSVEQEQILTLKELPSHDLWTRMTFELIAAQTRTIINEEGKKIGASFEEIMGLIDSSQKKVRDGAVNALNDVLAENLEIGVNEINAVMTNKKIDDNLRGYKRPDEARHLTDGVSAKTIDILLETVASQNALARQFYKLKAQLLGLPKLAYHERNMTVGKLDQDFSYSQASKTVAEAFEAVDPEAAKFFQDFQQRGQIDVYPSPGKMSGAFCTSWAAQRPTYVLLNYNDKLRDASIMGHEMGHGIHYELTKRTQPTIYQDISMATAEVASNYYEGLVLDKLKAEVDDEMRLALLMSDLNDTVSSTFRQAAFYRFEYEMHSEFRKAGYLSAGDIGRIFSKHMRSYMGSAVTHEPGSENWWLYVPHFRSFFYVYSYVSGQLIAKALQKYTYDRPEFIDKVKEFLAAGNSADAEDIFKELGIDINSRQFWLDGLSQIKAQLAEARRLATKLGKLK